MLSCVSTGRRKTSKCGQNISGDTLGYHLLFSVINTLTYKQQHGIYLFYIIKKQITKEKIYVFQDLSTKVESQPLPATLVNTKKAIDVICCLHKMKQSHA